MILMEIKQIYQIYELLDSINSYHYRVIICRNIKKYRLELYNKYKTIHKGVEGTDNPYSTDNVSSYLKISKVHYKRIENDNDKCKYVSVDNLIKLSLIFDKKLDDFLRE